MNPRSDIHHLTALEQYTIHWMENNSSSRSLHDMAHTISRYLDGQDCVDIYIDFDPLWFRITYTTEDGFHKALPFSRHTEQSSWVWSPGKMAASAGAPFDTNVAWDRAFKGM